MADPFNALDIKMLDPQSSVTRFGEISALWQNFKTLWESLDDLFSIWQNCKPNLENISLECKLSLL